VLRFRDLVLDPTTREVWRGTRSIELTPLEFGLLEFFLRHPNQVLTRSQIAMHVWGFDFGASSNSLNVYMGYLRRKLEAGGEQRFLHTIRGVGYALRES
jgi:two-component system, OmpR family, response regulator MprA